MTTPAIPAEEREINLLLALRNTAEGLTAAEIIKRVSGYNFLFFVCIDFVTKQLSV